MIDTPRIEVKVFCRPATQDGELSRQLVPVFHRWIREGTLDDLMIDVADYSHVPDGPGVLLVCHEAIYGIDDTGGERGLLFSRRREKAGENPADLATRVRSAITSALSACSRLESEDTLDGLLAFDAGSWSIKVNDRRFGEDHRAELTEAVRSVVDAMRCGDATIATETSDDRLGVRVGLEISGSAAALAALGGSESG